MRRRATFPHPGGNYWSAPTIVPLLPWWEAPFDYMESHCGTLAVLRELEESWTRTETVNDIDSDIANFYAVITDRRMLEEFCRQYSLLPGSCEELYWHWAEIYKDKAQWEAQERAERAVRWFSLVWWRFPSSWGGPDRRDSGTYNLAYRLDQKRGHIARFSLRPPEEQVRALAHRMREVQVLNRDATPLLGEWLEGERTVAFVDPPYPNTAKYAAQEPWHVEDFQELFEVLAAARGKWLLTIGNVREVRHMFREDWYETPFGTGYKLASGGGSVGPNDQVAVSNYRPRPREDPLQARLCWEEAPA